MGGTDETQITSADSEGAFHDYLDNYIEGALDDLINDGTISSDGPRGSDVIIELNDIQPPTFTYDRRGEGGQGRGNQPGNQHETIQFTLPFDRIMELIKERLGLPDLKKEGQGRIKETSYEFKTFGPTGVILDKRRTFKRALKTSIAMGDYRPEDEEYTVNVRRKDRRFRLTERVEKPKFKAAVFYIGDVSYSTYGERLEIEKHIVNFIQNWLDYNYGLKNVEHRFFVHEAEAYEVTKDNFYKVMPTGGTLASPAFELVHRIAMEEYDSRSTNLYLFYFGDGELYGNDADHCAEIIAEDLYSHFNRIGVTEIKPSSMSTLCETIDDAVGFDRIVRTASMSNKQATVKTIKILFGEAG